MSAIPTRAVVNLQDPETGRFRLLEPEAAHVSVFDRSFHFGDSLYEVTRTYDGILFSLDKHLRRLHASARLASFGPLPEDAVLTAAVCDACREFFRKYGRLDAYVRVTVSRGVGDLNIDRRSAGGPYAVVIVKEVSPRPAEGVGVHWALVDRRRNLPAALDPAMKSGNYLNNVLALAEAQARGADDALLLDYQGFVTEGTTSNFYAVVDGTVLTAPAEVGILRGITREWVLQVCEKEGIPCQVRRFTVAELDASREMFLSSSTREVQPITRLSRPGGPEGGEVVGDGRQGPVTRRVAMALRRFVTDWCAQHRDRSLFPD